MTKLTHSIERETHVQIQNRPLIVEILPGAVILRRKGTQESYAVPWDAIWSLGAKMAARDAAERSGR